MWKFRDVRQRKKEKAQTERNWDGDGLHHWAAWLTYSKALINNHNHDYN